MQTTVLRAIIVDDDADMLTTLQNKLTSLEVDVGDRLYRLSVDTLLVGLVSSESGGVAFSKETLDAFDRLAGMKFDLAFLDYSFSAPQQQRSHWTSQIERNGVAGPLLTLRDLVMKTPEYSKARYNYLGQRSRSYVFGNPAYVVFRSLQHPSETDALGSFENRVTAIGQLFSGSKLVPLDTFSKIYGSDHNLRTDFYSDRPRGREMYRNIVGTISEGVAQGLILKLSHRRAGRFLVSRFSLTVGLLASTLGMLGAISSILVREGIDRTVDGSLLNGLAVLLSALVVTVLGGFLFAHLATKRLATFFDQDSPR